MAAANVIANNLVGAGVDPAGVDAAQLAKLVEARARIPRQTFDEAIGKAGDPSFSAAPYLEHEVVSDASELDPVIERGHRGEPRAGGSVPGREGGVARLLRRPGAEGDGRRGRPARRLGARAGEAGRLAPALCARTLWACAAPCSGCSLSRSRASACSSATGPPTASYRRAGRQLPRLPRPRSASPCDSRHAGAARARRAMLGRAAPRRYRSPSSGRSRSRCRSTSSASSIRGMFRSCSRARSSCSASRSSYRLPPSSG